MIRNPWLLLLTTLGALVVPVAAAQADAAWTGASTSSAWSDAANWSGATPPTSSTGTLSFPPLGTCGTCYSSRNDLVGVNATGLVLGNSSSQYQITGNSFTIGSDGINDTPGHGTGDVIKAPIALSGSQTWVVGTTVNNGYNSLTLQGGVTGDSGDAVTMSTPNGDLFVDSNMEAGPVTSEGPGGLHIGGAPGTNQPGSVNGSDGQPVTVNGGFLVPNPGSKAGPLNITAGTLLLGTNTINTGTTTLDVNGAATLGSSSTTSTFINDNGSTPGTDFSQLSATGDISVAGSLVLGQGLGNNNNSGPCVALQNGDVATLVTTTGTLSGTFSNAPDGATLTMASSCENTPPRFRIDYTPTSVAATVVGGAPTPTSTTLRTPSPSPASTNQSVTLTASVTTQTNGTLAPSGTVAFSANGSVISGCTSQPLTTSGSAGTATCSTSFPASTESLTAAFSPSAGSDQAASISSAKTLTVNRSATTTSLVASDTSLPPGGSVTYTATVTPQFPGVSKPSGTVAFRDGSSPISGCTAQPVTAGSSSSTATCTVSYPAAGSHSITASYAGDPNFTASTSPAMTVTVRASATMTTLATPSPSPASTNQPVTLTAVVTGGLAPAGTVAFSGNAGAISGCTSQPLSVSGSSGTATCTTSFPSNGSPESLTAAFTPTSGSGQAASTSSAQTLTVNPAATTSGLSASDTSPTAGSSITYTATVTPANTGASEPSGTVAFLDGSSPISGCTAQPVTAGLASSTATCTVSYPAAGSHAITASYPGDPNFTASTSPATAVTLQAPSATSRGGTGASRPAVAALVLSRVSQSHVRWRERPHDRRAVAPARRARAVPVGTRFTFRVNAAARITLTFIQVLPGRRVGRRCLAPTRATSRARACHRARTRGRLVQSVGAGTHHVRFDGRLGRTNLPRGSYSVVVTAAATSGARPRTVTLRFTIVG